MIPQDEKFMRAYYEKRATKTPKGPRDMDKNAVIDEDEEEAYALEQIKKEMLRLGGDPDLDDEMGEYQDETVLDDADNDADDQNDLDGDVTFNADGYDDNNDGPETSDDDELFVDDDDGEMEDVADMPSSTFADADEFAALLEESGPAKDKKWQKQRQSLGKHIK